MNEFDDLFEKRNTEADTSKEINIEDFNRTITNQKHNGILFLIYIVINVVFTFGALMYFTYQYPNPDEILDNIVVITEPDINLQYGTDTTVISVDFTASLLNSSDKDLSQIWVTIELFDADEES
ncbi:MAG: hypothetical protein KAH13_01165, partial [Tenericutes bacterium]|nr:hypothetical protein [Mycoplasmatota bacterium]